MIFEFKPYPAYKPSGIEWLGEVPEHWEIRRAKSLFKKIERPIREGDEVITCFRDGTVTLRRNRRESGFTESLKEIGYQGIRIGDLVIHSMDAFAGAIGVADSNGKGSPVYSVCIPSARICVHFYAYLLREMAQIGWIEALAKGIRERSSDFRYRGFAEQLVPLLPLPEQTAIAHFLDHATNKIERHILEKQKLIMLLEEYKQAIIHQAVTGQIDVRTGQPYPACKPSGVEWLGEVPEHWHIAPVKRYYSIQLGKMLQPRPTGYSSRQVHYLKARNIQWFDIDLSNLDMMYASNDEIVQYEVRSGDLLVCEGGEGGRCAIVDNVKLEPLIIQNALHRVRPLSNDNLGRNDYLQYVLRVVSSTGWFDALNNRATIAHFTAEKFGGLNIPAPPLTEQTAISDFLEHAIKNIIKITDHTKRQIELLQEYRTRLIADAVTGKIDVREAAEELEQTNSGTCGDEVNSTLSNSIH
ncbi:MAG: restriction endonuclease subunit S [Gammaproteobacteria bacterium]|nr:restriction endonuclease subunit S [Gammaproteobacteria bacterium]